MRLVIWQFSTIRTTTFLLQIYIHWQASWDDEISDKDSFGTQSSNPLHPCCHPQAHRTHHRLSLFFGSPAPVPPTSTCPAPRGKSSAFSKAPRKGNKSTDTRQLFFFWLPLHWTAPITGISGASLLKPSPPNPLVGLQQKPSKESELEPSQMRPKCAYSRFPGCLLENPMDKTPINWSIKFYWLQFTTYLRYDPER